MLQSCARSIDLVARIGGEEFAVVLPESDASDGAAVAERARGAVEAAFEDDPVPLTISFGVVARPTHGLAAATLIRAADRALYQAKAKGRYWVVAPPAEALATDSVRELDQVGPRYRVPSRRDPQQALRG